jgi:translation elongation factor EF-1alpha
VLLFNADVSAGFVLCGLRKPVNSVRQFEAQLVIVEYPSIICGGYNAVMHAHTLCEEVSLVSLLHKIDKKTGRKSKHPPQFMKQVISTHVRATALLFFWKPLKVSALRHTQTTSS